MGEVIIIGLAGIGAMTLLAGAVLLCIVREEPRHVDPDLLVEIPPPSTRGGARVHTPPARLAFD